MNGVYGTIKPSIINPINDVDIFYAYSKNRADTNDNSDFFTKIESTKVSTMLIPKNYGTDTSKTILNGMYTLKLPVDIFGSAGIYTVYIKPKEYELNITDIGVLSSYSDVKGVIINASDLDVNLRTNDALCGYRLDYCDSSGITNTFRIITSSNKCEPTTQSQITQSGKPITYKFNEGGNLIFLTVTPSTAQSFKANSIPDIGAKGQKVILSNTNFNPLMIEVEMVINDIDTISTMLEGNQIRDLDNGTLTTFNKDNQIYKQIELFTLKDTYNGTPLYDVKMDKGSNIDSIDFNKITEDTNP